MHAGTQKDCPQNTFARRVTAALEPSRNRTQEGGEDGIQEINLGGQ